MKPKITDPYHILKHPVSTERTVRMIEAENKLVFIVDKKATKSDVKKAMEELFKVKVKKVNLLNSLDGKKKAYIQLASSHLASDLSAELGLI
ncbi:50S ribosomal protein L23 [Candidatus Woesearchaeota archaeon]|nr:50S ribosomal protein L23 [Candidatus Woesearchaeota archaeon]HLC80747.1 50S ribosomal protein L23 [Candidatus Nanoarchaeia archaeon]